MPILLPITRKRILVASNELATLSAVQAALQQANHIVTTTDSVLNALTSIENGSYDLVILDVTSPQPNGFAACAQLRLLSSIPIILLNTNRDHELRLYGFNMGADDYMIKPAEGRELVARVGALLRRADSHAWDNEISVRDLHIDLDERKVTVGGRKVELSPQEFNLLTFMASRPGYTFSRYDLSHSVWGAKYVPSSSNLVDVCICRLRLKLEANPQQPRYIVTVRGIGYRVPEVD